MPTIQPILEVPVDIALRLLTGELTKNGSVVRDQGGRIVTHLKEVMPENVQESGVLTFITDTLKKNKNILLGIGIVAAVVGGGAFVVYKIKQKDKKAKEREVLEKAEKYNTSLCAYLDAVRNRSLDIDIINNLMSQLDELKKSNEDGSIEIVFTLEQLDTLVTLIFEYTKKLAEVNSVSFDEACKPSESISDAVEYIRHYLDIQKQIFEDAA